MQANKNSNYQIKEKEKGFYHLKLVQEMPTADERSVVIEEKLQIFSVQGFNQYLEHKKHFNFKSEEIIHDPTLVIEDKFPTRFVKQETVEAPETTEEPAKPKKQSYFGSDKWKADMEAKRQLKSQKQ